jgi:hypothetical protein
MPMIRTCSAPGCVTLTMGDLCLAHERELDELESQESAQGAEAERSVTALASEPA